MRGVGPPVDHPVHNLWTTGPLSTADPSNPQPPVGNDAHLCTPLCTTAPPVTRGNPQQSTEPTDPTAPTTTTVLVTHWDSHSCAQRPDGKGGDS